MISTTPSGRRGQAIEARGLEYDGDEREQLVARCVEVCRLISRPDVEAAESEYAVDAARSGEL